MLLINNVSHDEAEELDPNFNYYVRERGLFIFKNYKTSKFYHTQVFDASEDLDYVIHRYLQLHKIGEKHPLLE